jgi:hypothetical protein
LDGVVLRDGVLLYDGLLLEGVLFEGVEGALFRDGVVVVGGVVFRDGCCVGVVVVVGVPVLLYSLLLGRVVVGV